MSELFDDKRILLPIIAVLLVIGTAWFGDAERATAVAKAERQQRLVLSEVSRTCALVARPCSTIMRPKAGISTCPLGRAPVVSAAMETIVACEASASNNHYEPGG